MNTLPKMILLGGVLLAADAAAFGHIDIEKFRQLAFPLVGTIITACMSDPECESELSDLSPKVVQSARYVTICWDLPHCKNASIVNFTAVCESNAECKEAVEELVVDQIKFSEECLLDHECKIALKSCLTNYSCRADFQTNVDACMAMPNDDNPACKWGNEIFPEEFLKKFTE